MSTSSHLPSTDGILAGAVASAKGDGPVSLIVSVKIKAKNIPQAKELWRELFADIDATEPAGSIKNTIYRRNADGDSGQSDGELVEFLTVQEYASQAIMVNYINKAKHEEVSKKVSDEGLLDGSPEPRFCTRVDGTKA